MVVFAQRTINKKGIDPILPLINDIEDILGSFLVAESEVSGETVEWDNTYSESYQVPSHLKMGESDGTLAHTSDKASLATISTYSRSIQTSFEQETMDKSSKRSDALTQALAYTHSRGE
jgi:hypothetical protein